MTTIAAGMSLNYGGGAYSYGTEIVMCDADEIIDFEDLKSINCYYGKEILRKFCRIEDKYCYTDNEVYCN